MVRPLLHPVNPNPIERSGLIGDGGEGNRTPDLLNAIQALSQLSYAPGRQEPKIVPRGTPKVKKTTLAKLGRASILQQLLPLKKPSEMHAPREPRPTRVQ